MSGCPNAGSPCNCTGACRRDFGSTSAPIRMWPATSMLPCDQGIPDGARTLHHFEASEHGVVCRHCGKSPSP